MSRSRWFLLFLCSLTFSGLLMACQRGGDADVAHTDDGVLRLGSVEVVDTVARAVAPSGRPLVLEGMRGTVQLRGGAGSTADLAFVRRGRGATPRDGQAVLEDISITERGTESAYTYTLTADRDAYAAVDVRGRVPRETALQIERRSGAVHVDGVEGALTIEHEHGGVEVQGAAAPVEVAIENGDVSVGFRAVPPQGTIRLRTDNGDVQLRLPSGARARVDAQTNVGVIRTQGLSFSAERLDPVNAGARYRAELGGGGPSIEVRTENGSITLRARDATPTDTTAAAPTVPAADTVVAPQAPPDTQRTDTMEADTTMADTSGTY